MDVRRLADGAWVVRHDPYRGRSSSLLPVAEALRFFRSRRVPLFLDVKSPRGERELARIVRRSGWLRRTTILAGSFPSLRRWRRLVPGRRLFWVTGYRQPVSPAKVARAHRLGLAGFVAYKGLAGRRAVERVHRAGMKIFVWTARSRRDLRRCARTGVDGVMSEIWPAPSI